MTLHNPFIEPTDDELHHASSPTAHLLDELQMYGYRPHDDEPDPRPLPEAERAEQEIANAFESLTALMADTRLEADLGDLLWNLVNIFHRKIAWLDRSADDNEQAQRRLQREQDGSEIKSVELERLIAEGDLNEAEGMRLLAMADNFYGPELQEAVRSFQGRHGLVVDARIGSGTQQSLSASAEDRARQIALNLERRRWLARDVEPERIEVNTAAGVEIQHTAQ